MKGETDAQEIFHARAIFNKLREAEVLISQGITLAVMLKKIEGSDCTYYPLLPGVRWHAHRTGKTP